MKRLAQLLRPWLRELVRRLFRVEVRGLEHYHAAGQRVLIIANHVSLMDGALLFLFLPEPPIFAVNTDIAGRRLFRPFLACVDTFLLDTTHALAVKGMVKFLREDRKAAIFPEGRISITSGLMKIYEGPGLIADRAEAAILAVGIEGAQYSVFSYLRGMVTRRWLPPIRLTFLPPFRLQLPEDLHGPQRRKAAARQLHDALLRLSYLNSYRHETVFAALCRAVRTHGAGTVIAEDPRREPLTYRALLARAFVLGDLIAGRTSPGEHLGIMLPNSTAALTAFLALHAQGRVPVMLNFTAGVKNVSAACAVARLRAIITSREFIEKAGLQALAQALAAGHQLVYLEDLKAQVTLKRKLNGLLATRIPMQAYHQRTGAGDPDSTAVILFTSGSEGAPKGVALSHANLLANYAQTRTLIALTQRDLVFNTLPMFHAFGLSAGTLLAVMEGARVFLYPTPLHYRLIPELCYELNATVLFSTNTFLFGYARYAHPLDFSTLRFVIAGAEKLRVETQRLWLERFGQRVMEGYGVTEASPVIAVNTPALYKLGTVGRLLTGIDYRLEPVEGIPRGGRLLVRGPNIMRGYINAEGGITPPTADAGPGWYDTGDIAELDAEGFLAITGRLKRFAKIGGETVPLMLTEELAMTLWPKAMHAALVIAEGRKGEQIVLLTTERTAERHALVEEAQRQGVTAMAIPKQVRIVHKLPQLASGKIDYPAAMEIMTRLTEPPPA
ncbi:MAG TPA: AMP-binding protein [Gammaproteobacteria bacterium]|nr:AMP-binding protein [Gammaproteobacteria bacterium]